LPLTVRLLDIYCHTLYVGSRVVFIGVLATGTIRENATERTSVLENFDRSLKLEGGVVE
jgi:hypothetical protein